MILKYIDDLISDPWIVSCEYETKNGYIGYSIRTSKNETISLLAHGYRSGVNLYFEGIKVDNCNKVVGFMINDVKFDFHNNIIIETNRGTIKISARGGSYLHAIYQNTFSKKIYKQL
jgi:hypothetical protein